MKNSIFLFFLLSAIPGLAQDWTGAVSSDWNNPANWSAAPSNGDNITIDPANYTGAMADPVVSANSSFTPAEMLVQGGAHLTIQASLSASDRVEILGAGTVVEIIADTFAVNGPGNNARLIFAEDAHLQMDGGTLIADQRLLFELGGTGEINAGTITIGETLALVDGSLTGPSTFVQNGGTITVNAEFGFENEAGEFYPLFLQTGGILNINGSLLWLGAVPGSGRGYFRATGGETTVTETIGNDPASTMGMHLEIAGNALFNNEGTAVTLLAGDSIVMLENSLWTDESSTWQNAGVVHAEESYFHNISAVHLLGMGSYQFANLGINALLEHDAPVDIFVSGNISGASAFQTTMNRIVLNGTAQQTINGTLTAHNLTVNNPAGILSEGIYIAGEMDLTAGIVKIDSPMHFAFFEGDATVVNASPASFIDGRVHKYGGEAFEFPIGESPDRYRPVSMTSPTPGAGWGNRLIRAEYIFEPHDPLVPVEAPLQVVSAVEYWDMQQLAGPELPVSMTIGWNDAAQSGLTDCADISLALWNETEWEFVPSVTSGQCDGNNAGSLSATTDLPLIGPLTIGFTEAVTQQAFELCFYETLTVGANTYDSAGVYIDILQDVNGEDSTVVTSLSYFPAPNVGVDALPTHLSAQTLVGALQWVDCDNGYQTALGATIGSIFYPAENGSYALVVQSYGCRDTSDCYDIVVLGLEDAAAETAFIWPNPVKAGDWLNIRSAGMVREVRIVSADGRAVAVPELKTNGEELQIALENIAAGSYQLLLLKEDGASEIQRLIVE